MAKNSFKVRNSLNIAPINPNDIVNPEAGDLIIDSSDDNKLKVFDEASSDWASVGSGGSSGNLMSDFEKLTPTVSNVVATVDTLTFLPIDDNNKSVKAVFSGSDGSIRYEIAAPADLDGVQGVVQLWIKTSVENLEVIATKNGVQYAGPLTVNSSNKWRQYEIPVVFSDDNYGFEIKANGSAAGDVYIDEAFVKVDSSMFQRNVSGAQFVGSGTRITSAQSINTSASTKIQFNSADMKIGSFDTTTNYRFIPDRTGNYLIHLNVFSNSVTAGTAVQVEVWKNGSLAAQCFNFTKSNGIDPTANVTCNVEINSLSDYIEFYVGSTDASYSVVNSIATNFKMWYFPDSTNTIVTQNTELTAQSANEFVANVSDTGVVSGENFDWINGSCSIADTSSFTCNFNSGLFEAKPICNVTIKDSSVSNDRDVKINGEYSSSSIHVRTFISNTTTNFIKQAFSWEIHCTRSTDYRKHATIVGKFSELGTPSAETLKLTNIPTYADDAAAGTGGLVSGDVYKTATGELRIKL